METKDYSNVPGYTTKSAAVSDLKFTANSWDWLSKQSSNGNYLVDSLHLAYHAAKEKVEKLLAEKLLAEANAKLLEQYTKEIDAFMVAIDNSLMSAGILLVKIEKDKLFKPVYVTFQSWLESNEIARKWSTNSIQLSMRLASNSLCVEFKDLGSGILKALDTFEGYVKQNPDKQEVIDAIAEFGEGKALYQLAKDKSLSVKAVREILDKAKGKAKRENRSQKNTTAAPTDNGDLTETIGDKPEPQGTFPDTHVNSEWRTRALMALNSGKLSQEELVRALRILDETIQYSKEIRNKVISMQASQPKPAQASPSQPEPGSMTPEQAAEHAKSLRENARRETVSVAQAIAKQMTAA